eukprot:Em0002g60a
MQSLPTSYATSTREGWPPKDASNEDMQDGSMEVFRKLAISISTVHGCLLYGSRVVIPPSLWPQSTTELLEQDLAHFGYPHTIVSDNATSFSSEEFQAWCRERCIIHLTGAPYHLATNGAAERLVQTFKQALSKSSLSPRAAVQHEKDARWVPAVVTEVFGTRSVNVRVCPRGGTWRRHIEQLCPRYGAQEDGEELPVGPMEPFSVPPNTEVVTSRLEIQAPPIPAEEPRIPAQPKRQYRNPQLPTGGDYTRDNLRRSTRQHHAPTHPTARGDFTSQ